MATKGAPKGNNNAAKGKLWNDALRKAIVQDKGKLIVAAVNSLLNQAASGEAWAVKELADRLDGKSMQGVELSTDPEKEFTINHNMPKDASTLMQAIRGTKEPTE